jgi:hypothetical protein
MKGENFAQTKKILLNFKLLSQFILTDFSIKLLAVKVPMYIDCRLQPLVISDIHIKAYTNQNILKEF